MAIVVGIGMPVLMFSIAEEFVPIYPKNPTQSTWTETTCKPTESTDVATEQVYVMQTDGSLVSMELETYLVGVLLGEMPMEFHEEALKAQAVVARTYTRKRIASGQKHAFGDVCTDSACCQAYCNANQYLLSGGSREGVNKAISAVRETTGQVLTYKGALIEATYFSCSGGRTEDAVAVWGNEIPYLQAVDSPGEEKATYYTDQVQYSSKEFAARLGIHPQGLPANWFGSISYTAGGGVDTMVIGGVAFKGTQLREKLELRSTAFSVAAVGDTIYISTKGFGHRVGMSQYGAEAMAVNGKSYEEILTYYYPGTSLFLYTQN